MSKTLIIGANGTVGSELALLLEAKGESLVLATSREPIKQNQVQLNLVTGQGLDTAFEDVSKAFFMAPPGYANQDELLKPLIEQAKTKNLEKVILMTAMGADAVESSPLRQAEIALENSGLNYNILRPNWFMQNFNTLWLQGILDQGKIFLPVGNAKGSFIDARDIAAVAAELLTSDTHTHQAFVLTGGEALNHDEVAEILSATTHISIGYEEIAPEAMRKTLLGAGLPEDYTGFLLFILDAFKQGYSAPITSDVRTVLGRAPISFQTYAQDHRNVWKVPAPTV